MPSALRTGTCARCGEQRPLKARNLCATTCYRVCLETGTLASYPRLSRPIADLIDDFRVLRDRGLKHEQIADQIGIKRHSMRRQLARTRAKGLLEGAR